MFLNSKRGFTIIELVVIIAIIGVLSAVVTGYITQYQKKARNAKRAADMQTIYIALNAYYEKYGCLPIVYGATTCPGAGGYSEVGTGGWDTSYEGGFLTFLQTSGFLPKVPVDPINNSTNYYRYYCYPVGWYTFSGLHLGYYLEGGSYVQKNLNGYADANFVCK